MRAVTANVSALRERLHDGFLAELFSIRLWSCPQVSSIDMFWLALYKAAVGLQLCVKASVMGF